MQMHLVHLLLLGCVTCLPTTQKPLSGTQDSPFTAEFDELVEDLLQSFKVPGLSIAVISDGETYTKGYGYAHYPDVAATPDTLYYTGSTTKSFTAAAAAMVIDDSRLTTNPISWTTPIASLIRDDFVMADDYYTSHVTLEDALSHRSGLPGHDYPLVTASSPREAVRRLRDLPITAEIRTKFQYCNLMFTTVSHVLETVTGMWLGDFFRTRIWEPLGMDSTYFSLSGAQKAVADEHKALAHAYFWGGSVVGYLEEPWLDIPAISGAGNIISSVVDYAKYLRMMLDYGRPLSFVNHIDLRVPRSFMAPELFTLNSLNTYSLGWERYEYGGMAIFEHEGGVPGFGALMLFLPGQKWAVAMMGNTGGTSNAVELILKFHLLDNLRGVPMDQRFPWRRFKEWELEYESERLQHIKQLYYPEALPPGKGMPHNLPLDRYAGIYAHPAYGTVNLTVVDASQHRPFFNNTFDSLATVTQTPQGFRWDFEHIGGEYFLVRESEPKGCSGEHLELSGAYKAEFVLGPGSEVEKLGVALVPSMNGDMMWFERMQ